MAEYKEPKNEPIERQLWNIANELRKNIDAAEYKHIALGLIFLKYISVSFEQRYNEIKNIKYADVEDKDEYTAESVFWVPQQARWSHLQSKAKLPEIGKDVDKAMDAIEKDNPQLQGVLPKVYAKENLDPKSLGKLIDKISTITLGEEISKTQDILGKIYEYFLGQFALAEGKKGGQFYTPSSIVKLLVAILQPYKGRVFDPCCGSGGMFVQSEKFITSHQGRKDNISIYGQESNQTTWRLCKMNLAIRGINSEQVQWNNEGSFLNNAHKDLKADYILANPPFNVSNWNGELLGGDARWQYGAPPNGNANYAWIQHFIYHLAPRGKAGFVLANGSMSSNTANEGKIRKSIIQEDLVEGIIALPDKLFSNTGIPACLWFINRDKKRKKQILFIDVRDEELFGEMINRKQRKLTEKDIQKIADTFHAWQENKNYKNIKGYCKSAYLKEIEKNDFIVTPGRYVGIKKTQEDNEPFEDKMQRLTQDLKQNFVKSKKLENKIRKNIKGFGFDI